MKSLIPFLFLTSITPFAGAAENTAAATQESPAKAVEKLVFSARIPGDDFPGAPCTIVFPTNKNAGITNFLKDSITGTGTEKDPLRTYAKFYYTRADDGSVSYEKEWPGTAEGFNRAFDIKGSAYERALYLANYAWLFTDIDYATVAASFDADALREQPFMRDEKTFKNFVQERRAGGKFDNVHYRRIAALRVDTPTERFLVYIKWMSAPGAKKHSNEGNISPSLLRWNGVRWVKTRTGSQAAVGLNIAMDYAFWHLSNPRAQAPAINFVNPADITTRDPEKLAAEFNARVAHEAAAKAAREAAEKAEQEKRLAEDARLDPLLLKLRKIEIPSAKIQGMLLSRAIETLDELSQSYAKDSRPVRIIFVNTKKNDPTVSVALQDTDMLEVLKALTRDAGYTYAVKDGAVVVSPTK